MRNLSPELASELVQPVMQPVFLAELEFDSQTVRLWTGYGNLLWKGEIYTGLGNMIGISEVSETQDIEAKGIVAYLTGIPSTNVALALLENCRGRPFRLYLGMFGDQGSILTEDDPGYVLNETGGKIFLENNFIVPPYRWFSGLMDFMEISMTGETHTISLSVENALIIARRSKVARYTDEDQRRRFTGDLGLQYINVLQDKEVVW